MSASRDPTESLLATLRATGVRVRRSGDGWVGQCPAHNDNRPSLSIATGDDGRCLVRCHAGCDAEDVVAALGLSMKDLMPPRDGEVSRRRASPRAAQSRGESDQRSFATADDAVAALEKTLGSGPQRWTYQAATGDPVFEVARWSLPNGEKEIRPVSRRGKRWVIKAHPEPRPLLHLPELARLPDGAWVYVVEGETCVDAARSIGFVATTSAGGSQAAKQSDWSVMKGKIVVVLPDNDAAGDEYADDVARLCLAAGAAEVRVVRLVEHWPGLPPRGDIVDVLDIEGGDKEALHAKIDALSAAAEPVESEDSSGEPLGHPPFVPSACFPAEMSEVADFFSDLARSTQTPPDMAALLGLAVASGCICNVACVRGYGDHTEPAPIWALVLSEPGTRKSAVLSELLRPILKWESERARDTKPEIAAAAHKRRLAEKRLRAMEDEIGSTVESNGRTRLEEDAIRLAQETESMRMPTAPVLLASEPTPEALARQMKENHGRALLASAEGDALDIIQGRYSGAKNYGVLLKGHAGDPIRAQRVGRPSDVIDRPALAVALCVQRAAVEQVWTDPQAEGRGLLARFAIIAPPDLVGSRDVRPEPVRPPARAAWHSAIAGLLSLTPCCDPDRDPVVVGLSPDADRLYHALQIRVESSLGSGDLAERREWGSKLCGLVLRIALTLHALSTWARGGSLADFKTISAETMRAAIAWADYLAAAERHARRSIAEPTEQRVIRRRVALIRERGGSVSIRDWQRARSLDRASDAQAELEALVEAGHGGWFNPAPAPRGGRPSRRFVLRDHAPTSDTTPPTEDPNPTGGM